MARDFIPQQLEDLTPSWRTQALRTRGLIGTAQVASVRHEVLGDGEGFMGIVARLFLDYDAPEEHAPQS